MNNPQPLADRLSSLGGAEYNKPLADRLSSLGTSSTASSIPQDVFKPMTENPDWEIKGDTIQRRPKGAVTVEDYQPLFAKAAASTGLDPSMLTKLVGVENEQLDQKVTGVSGDVGLFQHNPKNTVPEINKLFKVKYGRDYDPMNVTDNVDGTVLYLDSLKKSPKVKTEDDLALAYHMGLGGLGKYKAGDKQSITEGNRYLKSFNQ